MLTLFSQEKISEIHDYNLVKQARAEALEEGQAKGRAEGMAEGQAKGRAEGMVEGQAKGRAESKLEIAKNLLSIQIPYEQIAMATGLSLEDVEKLAI